jgi:hypothetical protein
MPSSPKFWFYGRFEPRPAVGFNLPNGHDVGERYKFALMGDAFWVTVRVPEGELPEAHVDEAEMVARVFCGAYALHSAVGHRPFIEAWVASDVERGLPSNLGIRRAEEHIAGDDDNEAARRGLGDLDFALRTSVYWEAALRDVGLATVDYTDDAFLFALRSLECCARAITGKTGSLASADWDALATCMQVTSEELRRLKSELTDVRHAVAHGDLTDPVLDLARQNRAALLDHARRLARVAVGRAEEAADAAGTSEVPTFDPRRVG